ncbi:DEAD/DEAH box helicase [Thalassospira alkalitolerans]|uniref:DEAD/DEAH box helicase n=1 Tax=Thalassospira alkalitolerans TaxID=1293890 RepID=UPI003AA7B4E3
MNLEAIRKKLSDPLAISENGFQILTEIVALTNDPGQVDHGREMVIRALAHRDSFREAEQLILNDLLRIVGLFPYLKGLEESDPLNQIAFEFHRPDNLNDDVVFHSVQARIYNELLKGKNVVLSAATSIGKSLVVDAVIASEKFRKIVIVVPTLALMDEIRKRLAGRFADLAKIITHNDQESSDEKINIYVLTQERVLQRDDLAEIDFFVIDEFYKLDFGGKPNDERVAQLNLAFYKLTKTGAQFYLSGPNVRTITGLNRHDCYILNSPFTTVAVDVEHFDLPSRGGFRERKLLELRRGLAGPTIVYCQGPGSANKVAELLLTEEQSVVIQKMSSGVEDLADWLGENYSQYWIVCRALRAGIAIHHGSIPRSIQQRLMKLFNSRDLHTIVCTSTIIEGVNTVAENVIIFDRRINISKIDYFTYKNIRGRAGRMGQYFVGRVFVLEAAVEEAFLDVNIAVETQDEETPLGLLTGIDEPDLSEISRSRLDAALVDNFLPMEVLREARGFDPMKIIRLSLYLRDEVDYFYQYLSWSQLPDHDQLSAACSLIFEFLSWDTYRRNHIVDGDHLAGLVHKVSALGGVHEFVRDSALDVSDSPSGSIDDALKLSRNVIMYRVPTDLMILNNVQQAVFKGLGYEVVGDFTHYASMVENGFLPHEVIVLDEYGIPIQIGSKIKGMLPVDAGVDRVLDFVRQNEFPNVQLTSFERNLLREVRASL